MIAQVISSKLPPATCIWLLIGLLAANPGSAQGTKPVTVVGHDYAFDVVDSVKAGTILFSLQNKGSVRHEVVVLLLKKNRTWSDYLAAKTPEERRTMNDGVIGLILAEPGQTAPGRLLAKLQKGRDYLLICNLRDTADKPQHSQLGMIKTLHVK